MQDPSAIYVSLNRNDLNNDPKLFPFHLLPGQNQNTFLIAIQFFSMCFCFIRFFFLLELYFRNELVVNFIMSKKNLFQAKHRKYEVQGLLYNLAGRFNPSSHNFIY